MDTFRLQPSLADSLQFGEQVVLVSESGGLHRAQQDAHNGHSWTFPADAVAFSGSSFPADALLVVLTGVDPKYIGFRSTFADGKLLAAAKGKASKLPHFEGHTFGPAEQWAVVGKSFHRCHVSNRKFPDKRMSVMVQRVGSGQLGRSGGFPAVSEDSVGASQEFEDLSLSSPRGGAGGPLGSQAGADKPKGRPSALQYALGGLEYLKLGPPVADEGSPVFLSPVNTPPLSPHDETPQSKLRELEVEGEGGAAEEGGRINGVVLRGRSDGERSVGLSASVSLEKYVEKLEARVADLQSQVMKYSQAAREAEEEVGRKAEVVDELEKKVNALASRQVTAGLAAIKASEDAEMEVEMMGAKLADAKLENAQVLALEKVASRQVGEMTAEREQSAEKVKEKVSAARAEGQSEAAEEYKERVREIKNEVEMHYADLLDVKIGKARAEIAKKAQREVEERVAAESAKAEVGVNKAVEKRTAAMRAELIATSSKQVKDRVGAARAEIESRLAKEVEQKVEVIRLANEASAAAYAEEKVADVKKKLAEVMMEGDVRVQRAREEAEVEAGRRSEEAEKKAAEKVAEVGWKSAEKIAKLEAKLKGMNGGGGREKGEMDAAEIKQAAFTLAEAKVAQARAEFAAKAEASKQANAAEVGEKVAKMRSDIEAKEAKKVAKKLTRLEELCNELEDLKSGKHGEGRRISETEWENRVAQAQVGVANAKAEEAGSTVRRLEVVNEALIKRLKDSKAKFAETIAGLEEKVNLLS